MSSGQSRSGDRDGGDRGDRGDRRPIGGGRGGQRRSKRYIFKVLSSILGIATVWSEPI